MMQIEDLGFLPAGEAPSSSAPHADRGRQSHNVSGGQLSVGQAGRGWWLSRPVEALRQLTGTVTALKVLDASPVLGFGMITYDRGHGKRCRFAGMVDTRPSHWFAPRAIRLKKTRMPLLPHGRRSRTAHGLTAAAAEGRRAARCSDCSNVVYPPRDACPGCLSARLLFMDVASRHRLPPKPRSGPRSTSISASMPWRVVCGVAVRPGPSIAVDLSDAREGERAEWEILLGPSAAAAIARPNATRPGTCSMTLNGAN